MRTNTSISMWMLAALTAALGCGGAKTDPEQAFRALRASLGEPVSSQQTSEAHSRAVERVVEDALLSDMTRSQVSNAIGEGDTCARHPKCAELGFESDDWFYDVGIMGDAPAPIPLLIVGFDHSGRVANVWYMRTHE